MTDLNRLIDAAYRADDRIHSTAFGRCTAQRSPGFFAHLKDRDGKVLHCAEDADLSTALVKVCRMAIDRDPMPTAMPAPGLTTRMPG